MTLQQSAPSPRRGQSCHFACCMPEVKETAMIRRCDEQVEEAPHVPCCFAGPGQAGDPNMQHSQVIDKGGGGICRMPAAWRLSACISPARRQSSQP